MGKGASNKKLPVKGVSTPIKLKLDNKVFSVKPYVIRDLTDPVNIGRKFMKKGQFGTQIWSEKFITGM